MRHIDWNVTARMREPHVRVHVPERALTSWVLLDASPSMSFGTADRRKADVAEGVALALGHLRTRRGNRLGVMTFGGLSERMLPPRQGRPGLLGLLAVREELPRDGAGATSMGAVLSRAGAVARRRGLMVVVSDFRGPRDWRDALLRLRARHDVMAVEIRDPREQELPAMGELWLVDPETGRQLRVDTNRRGLRERFAQAAADERATLAGELRKAGADHVVLWTKGDWLRDLARFLSRPRARQATTMNFRDPLVLVALILLPAAWLAYLAFQRRRARYAVRFTNLDLLANVVQRSPGWRRHVPPVLYLLALTALIVALAVARPTMATRSRRQGGWSCSRSTCRDRWPR